MSYCIITTLRSYYNLVHYHGGYDHIKVDAPILIDHRQAALNLIGVRIMVTILTPKPTDRIETLNHAPNYNTFHKLLKCGWETDHFLKIKLI